MPGRGWRNPVRYTTLEGMGVKVDELRFHSVKDIQRDMGMTAEGKASQDAMKEQEDGSVVPLSMADAKPRLGAYYGVPPESIEIAIRG
jgi:hypothetical protein